jgi:multiple sugar transport system substrate-binding protein
MASRDGRGSAVRLNQRQLLKAGAASVVAASQFPSPLVAQSKPFAGVTLRRSSYQHHFLTTLQGYISEFERQIGMKVELRLSPFAAYNRQITQAATIWPTAR